jgi:hypothetical protein
VVTVIITGREGNGGFPTIVVPEGMSMAVTPLAVEAVTSCVVVRVPELYEALDEVSWAVFVSVAGDEKLPTPHPLNRTRAQINPAGEKFFMLFANNINLLLIFFSL